MKKLILAIAIVLGFGVYGTSSSMNNTIITENSQQILKEASIFNGDIGYTKPDIDVSVSTVTTPIEELKVIPMGSVFGIKLYTDGVVVTALQNINTNSGTYCPAKDAGILQGDYITHVNGTQVLNNQHFSELVSTSETTQLTLTINRGDSTVNTQISPIFDSGALKLGMWIRDSAAGIGTVTFVIPETGYFGGLGHGICDIDTGELMTLKNGEPSAISISDIEKATENSTGKITGFFSGDEAMGILYDNTDTGVYGVLNNIPSSEPINIMLKEELTTGEVTILTSIDNTGPQEFEAYIESIATDKEKETKNFVIKITDEELLAKTGGIIQGMSGSPIIQDGKLVGAVTHVFVNDPTRGYGIYAENMLKSAEDIIE